MEERFLNNACPATGGGLVFWLGISIAIFFTSLRGKVLTALQLAGGDPGSTGQNIESKALARKILRNKKLAARFCRSQVRRGICVGLSGMRARIHCLLSISSVKVVRHKNGIYLVRSCGKPTRGPAGLACPRSRGIWRLSSLTMPMSEMGMLRQLWMRVIVVCADARTRI